MNFFVATCICTLARHKGIETKVVPKYPGEQILYPTTGLQISNYDQLYRAIGSISFKIETLGFEKPFYLKNMIPHFKRDPAEGNSLVLY